MKKSKGLTEIAFTSASLRALDAANLAKYDGGVSKLVESMKALQPRTYGAVADALQASVKTLQPHSFGMVDAALQAGAMAGHLKNERALLRGLTSSALTSALDLGLSSWTTRMQDGLLASSARAASISRWSVPALSGVVQKALAPAWSHPSSIFDDLVRRVRLWGERYSDLGRMTMRLDEALGTAQRVLREAGRATDLSRFDASGARALAAAMPLSGAMRLTSQLRPGASLGAVAEALTQLHAKPLGLAAYAVGRVDNRLSGVAAQALSVLAVLELDGDDAGFEDMRSTPLVSALVEMEAAVRSLSTDVSTAISSWLERMRAAGWGATPTPNSVQTFLTLLLAVVAFVLQEQRYGLQRAQDAATAEAAAHAEREHAAQAARNEALLGQILGELQRAAQAQQPRLRASDNAEGACVYAVRSTVVLRVARSSRSSRVMTVYPGDNVELLQAAGRYVRVRQCDYVFGNERSGWAPKKYFRRLSER